MLPRPKPGESEADLLRFQNQFLASKASPAVKIVKKAEKRRGNGGAGAGDEERLPLQHDRDVVSLDDFPDVPPSLTPGPPKKSKFRSTHVHFEDPEEQLDHGDQHITAVLSKIIEHDTSTRSITLPFSTGDPFPRVFHRSEIITEPKPEAGRKSIFSQKIAAKRAAEVAQVPPPAGQKNTEQTIPDAAPPPMALETELLRTEKEKSVGTLHVQCPRIVTGEGLGNLVGEQEAQKIHEENLERLQSMSKEEILEEQKRVLAQLDPSLVTFLKSRGGIGTNQKGEEKMELEKLEKLGNLELWSKSQPEAEETTEVSFLQEPAVELEPEDSERTEVMTRMDNDGHDLPLKPKKEWLHMDNVEFGKLEWMKDLPLPQQKKTRKGMQARFSLKGELISPDKDFPTYLGLHHHGEEAERAGYSLQELFHLSRSQVIQQRTLALHVLGHVVQKAKAGEFASLLKGSVLRVLLDAGFLFLLRFSLDDTVDNVIAAAVHTLHALLVSPDDEEYLDKTFSWYQGMVVYPFIPNKGDEEVEEEDEQEDDDNRQTPMENKSGKKSKDENKPDPEVAQYDVIKGLLKTKILHRLRYILEVLQPVPLVVLEILDVLIRIARHSAEVCSQVLDCPRLIETVVRKFIPTQWDPRVAEPGQLFANIHGIPCAKAMKLMRVLASGGRNAAARLLNKYEMKTRLSRFVAEDPEDLSLRREEAIRLSTEAFRLWAVAAGYGQACDLYRDLYPVLLKMIPSLSHLVKSSEENSSICNLSVERATAMVTLLSQITQTAGCRAELQAQLIRSGPEDGDQIPPPPVSWSQVSGFRTLIETNLKKCLKEISELDTWQALQPLATAYVVYLGLYYNNCSEQPSVNVVDCLEEVERLTFEVMLPLLNQPAMQTQWEMLRPCSILCNPLSRSPVPESVHSIVSLGCTGGKPPTYLVGSKSPFAFLTSLLVLVNSITHIHKGLIGEYVCVLRTKGLKDYLLQSWTIGPPSISHSSVWLLRHEYHLQYFVLALARKMVDACPDYGEHSSLHHCVAMVLLSRLLPGSECLAHELLLGLVFNPKLIPEGQAGGPEAADFSDILHLGSRTKLTQPGSVASISPHPSRGDLLKEAYQHLPFIQGCYLSHFVYLERALARSRDAYQGRTHLIQSMLLPVVRGPILPSDWPFLPLISLYNKVTGAETKWAVVNSFPVDLVNIVTQSLQWILLLETWRARILQGISAAAKLSRLMCIFLTGSDLFLESAVHCYTAALLSLYCSNKVLDSLKLDAPLPGLASFYDLYINLLEQFEGVSFGDPLFGVFVLLPLQRRFNVQLRMAVFGEHVSTLRALGVPLQQFPIPLELYLSPPEDNLKLVKLYFQTLVTGVLRQNWCPVLYVVAVAHVNSFIFSQESTTQEIDVSRKTMLHKTWLLADEVLKSHLLYYKLPNKDSPIGFDLYEQLPPIRLKYLHMVTKKEHKEGTSLSDL
ncbi:RNA polymerase II-associated protein 1 [Sphaerodactylus townsendi]|uniref:RNA polymerase II-associated protein 1 n=1 Tax=Sphaerodactylus townsendi TaxID=933632 RepID=UPI0020260E44|nr:RNA polymerase II-associated protein 1 [Sphaerodactylus townsendi]XP_048342039.1 RNA polymerase II-associated protein 1 [Sphaerodactylus townsendi]XP_048342040.1 RNA polymerase II-associated protein 1 [Sphaerodactylus townsendi]